MKIERFEELLDQYGWDLASWPEPLRREANVLISQDAHAAELLKSLRSIDDLLASDPLPMGKHKAIDDIFAAIEAEERKLDDAGATQASEPGIFDEPLDDRPRSRAHMTARAATAHGKSPVRKTYPAPKTKSPLGPGMIEDAKQYGQARNKVEGPALRRSIFSGVGMAVCVLAGFVFGVVLTAGQGQQENAVADELDLTGLLEQHFYGGDPVRPSPIPAEMTETADHDAVARDGASEQ